MILGRRVSLWQLLSFVVEMLYPYNSTMSLEIPHKSEKMVKIKRATINMVFFPNTSLNFA
jgi:hypothetical protein